MHTLIVGQRRTKTQQRKAEGFAYAFTLNVGRTDLDWITVEQVCQLAFGSVFKIAPDTVVKDVEISLDIGAGLYTLRFNTPHELAEDAYGAELTWEIVRQDNGEQSVTEQMPWDCYADNIYDVDIRLDALSLDDIANLVSEQ